MTGGRLHIDVTSAWDRAGQPVGISRIVTELARATRQLSEENQAWRYDARLQRMVGVTWSELETRVSRTGASGRKARPYLLGGLMRSAPVRQLKAIALNVLRRLGRSASPVRPFPLLGRDDRFVFADYISQPERLALYRRMIEERRIRTIFYCHDLIPLLFPELVEAETAALFDDVLFTFVRSEGTVICNSSATLSDLRQVASSRLLPAAEPRIISPGCDLQDPQEGRGESDLPAPRPYILYVSTIQIRKNHRVLLDAYSRLLERGFAKLPKLVFVGQPGWGVEDLLRELEARVGAAAHVEILAAVADADLRRLYEASLFTLFPSLYEGWGIPVSESLALGKFCLCSNRGAVPEAGCGLVELLDPTDADQWARRIGYYVSHPQAVKERERVIRANFKPRLWSDFRQDAMSALAHA